MAGSTVATRLAAGGRVVIPVEFRKSLGLAVGDEVLLSLEDGMIRISTRREKVERAIKNLQEMARRYVPENVSMVDELLAERRREAEAEANE